MFCPYSVIVRGIIKEKRRWKGDQIAEERRSAVLDPGSVQPTGCPGPGGYITKALWDYLVVGKFSPPGFRFLALHVNESAYVLFWTFMEMGEFWGSFGGLDPPLLDLPAPIPMPALFCVVVSMDQNRKIGPRNVLPYLPTFQPHPFLTCLLEWLLVFEA